MLSDYHIVSINNTDDGKQTITFRFYEGAITTEDEVVLDVLVDILAEELVEEPVTRYRRTAVLNTMVVVRDTFADRLSDSEIDTFGRVELAKIADHDPIEEQEVE